MSDVSKGCGIGCGMIIAIIAAGGVVLGLLFGGCIFMVANTDVSPRTSPTDPQPKSSEHTDPSKDLSIDRLNLTNYYRVKDGMTYDEVRSILGPASEELASSRIGKGTRFDVQTVLLVWKGSWGANCSITFQNGRVVAKAQFGLKQGQVTPDLASQEAEREKEETARRAATAAAEEKEAAKNAKAEEKARLEQRAKEEEKRKEPLEKLKEDMNKSTPEELEAKNTPAGDAAQVRAEQNARRDAEIEAAKWRIWTTADGKFKVEAKFVKRISGIVTLEKKDGSTVDVKLNILCLDDQDFVKQRKWRQAAPSK